MFGLGIGEIVVILVIALIFIGPKKLPELAKGLGKGMREFQKAAKGVTDSINEVTDATKIENIQNKEDEHSLNDHHEDHDHHDGHKNS